MNEQQKKQENTSLGKLADALNDRGYQYEMLLGEGNYGVRVVQAKCLTEETKNTYAIKCFPVLSDERVRYRERELKILEKDDISHENIVEYSGYWTITIDKSQFLFIRMELCQVNLWEFVYKNKIEGAEIIKAQGPTRFYQQVFPQILKGLVAIHDKMEWVHRDIHPGNILIANPDPKEIKEIRVKIADFGLAREIPSIIDTSPSLTEASKMEKLSPHVGNKLFRAPELDTQYYDHKVDLYSAGIVLYFLSRYLAVKGQWKKEIKAFRDGKRRSEDLFHQDDKNLVRLIQLLMQERGKRPTAKEALKIAEKLAESKKLAESQEPVESQILVEPKKVPFFVRKDSERAADRWSIKNDNLTLSGLKTEIERCTGVKNESQVLYQKTSICGETLINITSDEIVRSIFEAEEPVVIIASDSTDAGNREVKNFRVRKNGESASKRCSTKDNTLSSLKAEIQNCIKVEAESQVLYQQQTKGGKDCFIEITCDENVEEMFQSAEKTQHPVDIIVSDPGKRDEAKKFLITKNGEWSSKRCSIKDSNFLSLKAEIERQTGIAAELQVLHQRQTIENDNNCRIEINDDQNVEDMFKSAKEKGNRPDIFVSEYAPESANEVSTDAGDHAGKIFLIKSDNKSEPLERCLVKYDALNLSSLKEEIEKCTGIKAESQELCEKTAIHDELIKIKSDHDVQMMGQNAEASVVIVSDASAESLDMYG